MKNKAGNSYSGLEIAVIGLSGRFPGAKNIEEFWTNLKNGQESITFFSDEELKKAGVSPGLSGNKNYVKAAGILDNIEYFDASFFGYTPNEAEIMNPQTRMFYECVYEALEDAGYASDDYKGLIGVYAGGSINYTWETLTFFSGKSEAIGEMAAVTLANKDSLSTRISFKLNLKGPAVSLRTACSTSLVAIHMACRALLTKECHIALAGGVAVQNLYRTGYLHREGLITSPDGHCRPFDEKTIGTIFGDGVGVAALKKLKTALRDGDHIYAVIKGSTINNDGYRKVGYTAPSVEGQADVIASAQKTAAVEPESISYIETHGTGTNVGDTIEIEALKLAFKTNKKNFCAIGSIKSNIGHLDSAAGAAGFIKTVLALNYKLIPAHLHFETSNREIDFQNSPFYINTKLSEWKNNDYPLRAGVSSFGLGGTNAHVVLEEFPGTQGAQGKSHSAGDMEYLAGSQGRGGVSPPEKSRDHQLILLSAKTETALDQMTKNLAGYFKNSLLHHDNHENPINPGLTLADAAYTLQVGRGTFKYRKMSVCSTLNQAIDALADRDNTKTPTFIGDDDTRPVVFMFPGLGSQYVNMGRELYQKEPVFRDEMDRCFGILNGLVDYDLKEILYPDDLVSKVSEESSAGYYRSNRSNKSYNSYLSHINQTQIAQPVLFIFEYALAQLLMKWGIKPQAIIGYSFGEYVAACAAGIFSLEDALKLVVSRGKLIQQLPEGAMLSVPLPLQEVTPLLNSELSPAIDNGPSCIVAGPGEAVRAFAEQMKKRKILCVPLPADRAIHSKMMEPISGEFERIIAAFTLNKPQIPFISNVTGTWLHDREVTRPAYWGKHLRQTVQFAAGMRELVKQDKAVFIEIGPGQDLSALALRYIDKEAGQRVINLVRHPQKNVSDVYFLVDKIGKLWLYGVKPDWFQFGGGEKRSRIPLPTYPFERQRYWIDLDPSQMDITPRAKKSPLNKTKDVIYVPSWKPTGLPRELPGENTSNPGFGRLMFIRDSSLSSKLVKQLENRGETVFRVKAGTGFKKLDDFNYSINPGKAEHYDMLLRELQTAGLTLNSIVHLWNITGNCEGELEFARTAHARELGLYSLLHLARAIENHRSGANNPVHIKVITNNMQKLPGEEMLCPGKAPLLAAVKMIPRQYPGMTCRSIDISIPAPGTWQEERLTRQLLVELKKESSHPVIVYRGDERLVQSFAPVRLSAANPGKIPARLKEKGTYLFIGGEQDIGFEIARHLALTLNPKLVFIENKSTGRLLTKSHISSNLNEEIDLLNKEEKNLEKRLEIKGMETYNGLEKVLNDFCAAVILDYFKQNAIDIEAGKIHGLEDLKKKLKILPKFDRFYDFFITVLSEDRMIAVKDNKLEFLKSAALYKEPSILAKEIEGEYPEFKGTVRLIDYCRKHYSEALSGTIEAISVLYPGGDYIRFREEYRDLVEYSRSHLYVLMFRELIFALLKKSPPREKFRILEIGGGKGILTSVLAPGLKGSHVEYHFTDIGNFFVINARKEAANQGFDFMEFGILDITKDPAGQGYQHYSFDVVVGMNVVHATKSIEVSLENLKKLLAPNGILCLIELTNPGRWMNLIDGLAEGWWYYEDNHIRSGSPLLNLHAWQSVYEKQGFKNITSFPRDGAGKSKTDVGLIFGQQASEIHTETRKVKDRIGNLKGAETNGVEVKIIETDVTHREQMTEAIARVEAQWGPVRGIVHCARGPGNPHEFARTLEAEIKSVLVVDGIFKDTNLDFHVICSSSDTGGDAAPGIGNAAALHFFDAFAHYKKSMAGRFVVSINWEPGVEITIADVFGPILEHSFARVTLAHGEPTDLSAQFQEYNDQNKEKKDGPPAAKKYQRGELSSEYAPPGNRIEEVLADIWQDFLGIGQVGIYDDFLELGTDSLVFITIAAKIQKILNVKVPISAFFDRHDIKDLAAYIEGMNKDIYTSMEVVEKKEYYLLSSAQKRLYIQVQLDPASTGYNVPVLLRVEGDVDKGKFQDNFRKLILRHESLRTSFVIIDDCPVQKIQENADFEIEYSEAEAEVRVEKIIGNFIRPFDVSRAPLLRARLIQRGNSKKYIFLVDMPHIITDGISGRILAQDFMALYGGKQLRPLRLQYKDYAQWQNREKGTAAQLQQAAYWLEQFPGDDEIPVLELPTDFPRSGVRGFAGGRTSFVTTPMETRQLRILALEEGVTLYMVLLAVFYVFLARITNQEAMVIGTLTSGRRHDDLEPIIGMFVNTLGLINFPQRQMRFNQFLENVNQRTLNAFENQDYPFEELVEKAALKRDKNRNPLFDVMFAYLNIERNKLEIPGLKLTPLGYEKQTSLFDLALAVFEYKDILSISFEYSSKLFKKDTILEFVGYFKKVLAAILADRTVRLENIQISHGYSELEANIFDDGLGDF